MTKGLTITVSRAAVITSFWYTGRKLVLSKMMSAAASRTLDGHRHLKGFADLPEHGHVLLPAVFVEVHREKVALFIREQRVDACDKVSSQMCFHDLLIQSCK